MGGGSGGERDGGRGRRVRGSGLGVGGGGRRGGVRVVLADGAQVRLTCVAARVRLEDVLHRFLVQGLKRATYHLLLERYLCRRNAVAVDFKIFLGLKWDPLRWHMHWLFIMFQFFF